MRAIIVFSSFAVVIASSATAAEVRQFDLQCSTRVATRDAGVSNAARAQEIYRIDLDRRLYCKDQCTNIRQIADITPAMIVLENEASEPAPPAGVDVSHTIDRRTLAMHDAQISPGAFSVVSDSRCVMAPYKSIPKTPTNP
ncbi:hypothetical protein [Caulobacter sp. S45]|uniref:hypothetical protein n=1 Tax=Caulobacter sp. S45 TaxID=1641861 RepID=UPI00131BD819|nr:hypothetical protein [Caulobacter sp. S45]